MKTTTIQEDQAILCFLEEANFDKSYIKDGVLIIIDNETKVNHNIYLSDTIPNIVRELDSITEWGIAEIVDYITQFTANNKFPIEEITSDKDLSLREYFTWHRMARENLSINPKNDFGLMYKKHASNFFNRWYFYGSTYDLLKSGEN